MSRSNRQRERTIGASVQDTHLGVSDSSTGSDTTNNSSSSYGDVQGVTDRHVQERLQNVEDFNEPPVDYDDDTSENELSGVRQSTDCYIPRGPRFNYRTFRGQLIPPLSPLDHQQENVGGTGGVMLPYNGRRQCADYDNSVNEHGMGNFRSSNHSGGSDSTHPSGYEHVQGAQSSPRYSVHTPPPHAEPSYVDFELGLSPRATETDHSNPKHKSCSMKKICKFAIWIAIFLGISCGIALSTLNNLNNSDLKDKMEQGNNEINKTLASSLKMINVLLNKSLDYVKDEKLSEIIEELKRNITGNGPGSGSGSGSGSDSGGQCYNTTTSVCVDQCYNMCDGDYQSCATCKGFVSCANRILWHRNCSDSHLVWDDHIKRCESASSTCF